MEHWNFGKTPETLQHVVQLYRYLQQIMKMLKNIYLISKTPCRLLREESLKNKNFWLLSFNFVFSKYIFNLGANTQNNNKSLIAVIWHLAKHLHAGLKTTAFCFITLNWIDQG